MNLRGNPRKAAATIIFKDGVPRENAQKALDMLAQKGYIEPVKAQWYDPDHGEPVFYIP